MEAAEEPSIHIDRAANVVDQTFAQIAQSKISQIIRVLDANQVPYYQVMRVPGKSNEIEIIGCDVEKLHDELVLAASNNLVIKDVTFYSSSDSKPLTTNWIKLYSGIRPSGTYALAKDDHRISTINAIMQALDKRRRRPQNEYFGMTTAHSFLSDEQNKELMASSDQFVNVSRDLASESFENVYYMDITGEEDVDIIGIPRFLYRYWIKEYVTGDWGVLQDIALFILDANQVRTDGLLETKNEAVGHCSQQKVPCLHQEALIVNILSIESLRSFDGQAVKCRGKQGTLVEAPWIKDHGCVIGAHLAFVLEDNEELLEGDCGSFVCLSNDQDGRLPILGMFIGHLKSNRRVHQAAILSWNIERVEATPDLKMSGIKLADESIDFDQGYCT